ncbi:MAG: NAD-P-binding protein [Lentinula lateritia]|uniref:NAD(P)-binding protein n=1 Tax=Lentinula lateritia TaxID=40482 RepID=A0ABQ8VV58_9AGAR|nr:NAD-P-binding protein [Lentinula novae-zelandiae]KAJ3926695.1 MAG: NAD-P-binding protein [Lentinula lateritia]KAJ4498430.1 hypothetical protein C8R41DRAFT_916674 [Lentinula lateritia]
MATTLSTSLTDKVAIVTGSSRGIGAAIALRLAEEGAKVVVNYVSNLQAANEVVQKIKLSGKGDAVAIKADISTVEAGTILIDETLKLFGKLDILVLNAAALQYRVLADVTEHTYDTHMNTNVKGPLFLSQAASKHFPSSGGRIIFLSSSTTSFSSVGPNYLEYAMSKGAVEQMSRILAKDLSSKNATVNTVSPGPVDTELFRAGKPQSLIDLIASQNPSKRIGRPEEIAPVVAFLASEAAQWVNGQNIGVNGGFIL